MVRYTEFTINNALIPICHTPKPRMAETSEGGGLHVEYNNNEYNSAQSKYNHHKYNWKSYTKVYVYMIRINYIMKQNDLFDDLSSHPQNVVDFLFHWIPENTSSFEKCQYKGWWVHKLLTVRVWKSIIVKRCMLPRKIQYFPFKSYVVLNPRTKSKQVFSILKDINMVLNPHKTLFNLRKIP